MTGYGRRTSGGSFPTWPVSPGESRVVVAGPCPRGAALHTLPRKQPTGAWILIKVLSSENHGLSPYFPFVTLLGAGLRRAVF